MLIAPDVNSILIAGGSDVTPSNPSLALIKWSKPGVIYVARNRVNGHRYVGQTVYTLAFRRKRHIRDAINGKDWIFQEAIRKYGEDAFDWCVVQTCNDRHTLNAAEIWWIQVLGSLAPNGYNLTTGGGAAAHTDRTKKKISAIAKKWSTPERMKAMSEKAAEKGWTEEMRAKLSATLKRKYANGEMSRIRPKWTPEHHAKKKLQIVSEESRKKMGDSRRGKPRSEETKKKIGDAFRGKKQKPENIEKRRLSRIGKYTGENSPWFGRHHTEESLEKMSQVKIGIHPSDEQRKKMRSRKKRKKKFLKLARLRLIRTIILTNQK